MVDVSAHFDGWVCYGQPPQRDDRLLPTTTTTVTGPSKPPHLNPTIPSSSTTPPTLLNFHARSAHQQTPLSAAVARGGCCRCWLFSASCGLFLITNTQEPRGGPLEEGKKITPSTNTFPLFCSSLLSSRLTLRHYLTSLLPRPSRLARLGRSIPPSFSPRLIFISALFISLPWTSYDYALPLVICECISSILTSHLSTILVPRTPLILPTFKIQASGF
ncbi:uncharacterized protein BJX67DRAFT_305585 [Aspergillus lucknowensis]|uniref:Uncharacterized protein n=1 Tax=Aspergillus lucknowensis TaxID=176173 RepID=A0ABR4M2S2_9EURO